MQTHCERAPATTFSTRGKCAGKLWRPGCGARFLLPDVAGGFAPCSCSLSACTYRRSPRVLRPTTPIAGCSTFRCPDHIGQCAADSVALPAPVSSAVRTPALSSPTPVASPVARLPRPCRDPRSQEQCSQRACSRSPLNNRQRATGRAKCPVFMRFSVTLLVLPPEPCDTTSVDASESNQCPLTATPALRDSTRFSSQCCLCLAIYIFHRLFFSHTPKARFRHIQQLQPVAPRIGEQKHMAAFRVAAQMIAHQAISTPFPNSVPQSLP